MAHMAAERRKVTDSTNLPDKQRAGSDNASDNKPDNKRHNTTPPFNVSVTVGSRNYTKE